MSADGGVAYLTLKGSVQPQAANENGTLTGSVSGSMVVDRRRGWLSESRFLVQMRTTVLTDGAAPMQFRMKISQHMKVFER